MKKGRNLLFEALKKKSSIIKKDILKISYLAQIGHIGSALSIADILTVLYNNVLRINSKNPLSQARDRFILSKGHAAAALYATLYRAGFISRKTLRSFCKDGGSLGVHPEYDPLIGLEFSTGSLGHGLSVGAGIALGLKKLGNKMCPRVYVLVSDGELNEGSTWEAIMFAAHHKLSNLIVVVDDNKLQAFGATQDVISMQPLFEKWEAFGWHTITVNGHSIPQLYKAFTQIPIGEKPYVIIANTTMGKGVTFMENRLEWHYLPLSKKQYKIALLEIGKK